MTYYSSEMIFQESVKTCECQWIAVKNILKYLRRTKDAFLVYGGEEELVVNSYTDASFQTDKDDIRSQSGFMFCLNEGAGMDWSYSHTTRSRLVV